MGTQKASGFRHDEWQNAFASVGRLRLKHRHPWEFSSSHRDVDLGLRGNVSTVKLES